jgi:hypothetical protein
MGADLRTLKQSELAMCFSTAEYCAAVWETSAHASKVDIEFNKVCQIITGNLKATPIPLLYRLKGICPPGIHRAALDKIERGKQLNDPRHPLHGHQEVATRLKSRNSFR